MSTETETSNSQTPAAAPPQASTTPATPSLTTTSKTGTESLVGAAPPEGAATTPEASPDGKDAEGGQDAGGTLLTADSIKLPEGFTAHEPTLGAFIETMNDTTLSREALAQKLVDIQVGMMQEASEAGAKAWNDLQDTWKQEAEKLPDFGGPKLQPTLNSISRLISEFGGDAAAQTGLREAMDLTGAGNHPQVIAFLGRIANKLVKEGSPVTGSPQAGREAQSVAQRLFPDLKSTG